MKLRYAALLLTLGAIGCGSNDGAAGEGPVKIRMGWGIPAEEIKYVMMHRPEVAEHLGTSYEIEWQEFSGTALGVQGLAATTVLFVTHSVEEALLLSDRVYVLSGRPARVREIVHVELPRPRDLEALLALPAYGALHRHVSSLL